MKNNIILLLLLTTVFNTAFSQEKIKGNKNITRVKTDLKLFNKIIVSNDFKVVLLKSESSSIDIETDENIHDAIGFSVIDSTLTISTTLKIRAKRLNITVFYKNSIEEIILNNDAELESSSPIKAPSVLLQINDFAIANLNIESDKFNFINNNKSRFQLRSKSNLEIKSKEVDIVLHESSNTKINVETDSLSTRLMKNAILDIKGSATSLSAFTIESANFKGEELEVDNCTTNVKDNGIFTIQASDEIIIDASGKSRTEIYGDPKIIIKKFADFSKLYKKEL